MERRTCARDRRQGQTGWSARSLAPGRTSTPTSLCADRAIRSTTGRSARYGRTPRSGRSTCEVDPACCG